MVLTYLNLAGLCGINRDDGPVASRQHVVVSEISDRDAFEAAVLDPIAGQLRLQVCEVIAEAVQALGHSMWVGGFLLRDDWARGLGIVVQMGGELAGGAVVLLRAGRHYPVAALVRQLVEVEYLALAFSEDQGLTRDWLTSTPEQLRALFQPAAMRRRSGGRFRDSEYWGHCEGGGHPHPRGAPLLPEHSGTFAGNEWLWGDLAQHLDRLWRSLLDTVKQHEWTALLDAIDVAAVEALLTEWHAVDPLASGITLPSSP